MFLRGDSVIIVLRNPKWSPNQSHCSSYALSLGSRNPCLYWKNCSLCVSWRISWLSWTDVHVTWQWHMNIRFMSLVVNWRLQYFDPWMLRLHFCLLSCPIAWRGILANGLYDKVGVAAALGRTSPEGGRRQSRGEHRGWRWRSRGLLSCVDYSGNRNRIRLF
jgi:hypothetical protein